jgi:hypothetical protein
MQCRFQLANLAFRAFDHPSLPKQMATGNHTISLAGGTELPQTRRFNQLWKWYEGCVALDASPPIIAAKACDRVKSAAGKKKPRWGGGRRKVAKRAKIA